MSSINQNVVPALKPLVALFGTATTGLLWAVTTVGEFIVNFVAEGLGIAFVPASMQRSQIKGAVFRKLDNPPTIDQLLYWSLANKNPCLAGFIALSER